MKLINIPILYIILILISTNVFSQDDIKNYRPPKLMKGFNLTLGTSPSVMFSRRTDQEKYNSYFANINASISHWKFTDDLLYAVGTSISGAALRSYYSGITGNGNNYTDDRGWGSEFNFSISGGASYYPVKDFYANLYVNSLNRFGSRNYPYIQFEIYPGIGYGRMYDVSRVAQMQNFENVLMNEKIINTPLKNSLRKKLIEILDKRNDRDFLSMFKDDGDIEFFAKVEDMLKDEGVVQGNLGSRAILKMYQAITNSSFVYFPVFKGFQVQAETKVYSKYNYDNSGNIQNYCIYLFNAYMLSSIYGLPVNRKLSFITSMYTVIPVFEKFLQDRENLEFNSPITLVERNALNQGNFNAIDQLDNNNGEDFTKMDIGLSVKGFYSFSRFCGLAANLYTIFKLRDYMNDNITGGAGASFVFNILNHLKMNLNFGVFSSKTRKYQYDFGSSVLYYVF